MSPSPKQFAALLTEGIFRIRARENKSIQVIQEELSWTLNKSTGAALAYWRQGHIPSNPEYVAILARQMTIRSDVDRAWVMKFLQSGGYPNPNFVLQQLFWEPQVATTGTGQDFPPRTYPRLVGRTSLIQQALEILRNTDGPRLIGIDGLGGIGKTALAREIAQRALQEGLFEKALWISAATNRQAYRVPAENRAHTFEEVLQVMVHQLTASSKPHGLDTPDARESWVRRHLHQSRVLIILDNLETASTPQDEITRRLLPLLGFSRAILTSRKRFIKTVFPLRLMGLEQQEALEFIQMAANRRNIFQISAAPESELAPLIQMAGGSPLALELMIGQLQFLPLATIITHLKEIRPIAADPERDEYFGLYQYIYQHTWKLLTPNGRELLQLLARFPPHKGEFWDVLGEMSSISKEILPRHIQELWLFSLLESEPNLSNPSYSLHPLTQAFVLADISRK